MAVYNSIQRQKQVLRYARWRGGPALQVSVSNPAIGGMKALALVLLIAGCSYWGRRPVDELKPIAPDVPVWIWTTNGVEKWYWVEITPDSVSGVPRDSRMTAGHPWSIPRAQVDSMKVGYTTWVEYIVDSLAGFVLLIGVCCY